MPDTHHRTVCVAFGAGIPQETFVSKPSPFPLLFILCTNNLAKKTFCYFVRHSKQKKEIEEQH